MANGNAIETRISEVAKLLYEGKKRNEIVTKITKSYKVSAGMVDKYIKHAKATVAQTNRQEAKLLHGESNEALLAISPKSVMSKMEKRQFLAKVVRGEYTTLRTIIIDVFDDEGRPTKKPIAIDVYPTQADISRAIEIDNVMSGDNAPVKQDIRTLGVMQVVVKNETDKNRISQIGKSAVLQSADNQIKNEVAPPSIDTNKKA